MPSQRRLKVLVAENHPVYREALVDVLRHRAEVESVDCAASGTEALELIRQSRPDVVLLDMDMPGLDGLSVARAVAAEGLPTRTLLLSDDHEPGTVGRVLASGAAGFIPKVASASEIGDAIVAASRGETVVGAGVESPAGPGGEPADTVGLSAREREVLRCVADGLSSPDIARHLGLRTTTVKTHLQHIYEKLGVNDRAAAVAAAMRRDLLR